MLDRVGKLGLALPPKNVSALALWEKCQSLKGFLLGSRIDLAQSVTHLEQIGKALSIRAAWTPRLPVGWHSAFGQK